MGLALVLGCIIRGVSAGDYPIVLVTASYKNAHLMKKYFDSIVNQTVPFKKLIYVADNDYAPHSDGTGALAEEYVKKHNLEDKAIVIRNKHRQLALQNLYKAILACDDNDVVAVLDGDDMLAGPEVLQKVTALYSNPSREIWATYGNFKSLSTNQAWGWTQQIPSTIIEKNAIRTWGNGPTHLKTFKAWVFKQILIKDLFYEGDFLRSAYDVAIFEPMYEMIGDRFDFTQDVLYIYNDLNPINDGRVNRELQLRLDHFIRSKPPYQRLQNSLSGRIDTLKSEDRLKADVMIFVDKGQEVNQDIERVKSTIKNTGDCYVIVDNPNEAQCTNAVCHKTYTVCNLARLIYVLKSDYVLLISAHADIPTLDVTEALTWLEKTHAHAFYGGLTKKIFDDKIGSQNVDPILISLELDKPETTYAWQYQNKSSLGLTDYATIIRKADLVSFLMGSVIDSIEELNESWNKMLSHENVGLFFRGNEHGA
jgi:glycosyltransferase involved in cell wall biosynthesis